MLRSIVITIVRSSAGSASTPFWVSRFDGPDEQLRVLFAFGPERSAIKLIAGDT
jgi:hypothetical protein